MDILHPGNWPEICLVVTAAGAELHLYECPLCFALTREPLDHGHFHVRHHGAHTTPSVSRVRQVGKQQ